MSPDQTYLKNTETLIGWNKRLNLKIGPEDSQSLMT